jgi:hypothetical protein
MSDLTERKLGWGFGLLGGVLLVAAAIVGALIGTFDLVTGRLNGALNAGAESVLLLAVGALALLFSYLAYRPWRDHPITAGILLVVVAAIGWGVLGLGGSVIALLGALCVFLAGLLFLLQPALSGVKSLATA